MALSQSKVRLLVLLLVAIVLAGQFHLCADLTTGQSSSHICPVCSTTVSIVSPSAPIIIFVPVQNPIDVHVSATVISVALPRSISPRAPPSL